jgi:hypothetical protein
LFKMNKNETENGEPNTDNEAVGDINEPNWYWDL